MVPEDDVVARKAIQLIEPIPLKDSVPDTAVCELIEFSHGLNKLL